MKKGNAKKLSLNKIQVSKLVDMESIKGGADDFTWFWPCHNGGQGQGGGNPPDFIDMPDW